MLENIPSSNNNNELVEFVRVSSFTILEPFPSLDVGVATFHRKPGRRTQE